MPLVVKAATDLGLKRSQNEDSFRTWLADGEPERGRGTLLVVADGMGGSQAGEVASRITVDTVYETYREGLGPAAEDLARGIAEANRRVFAQSQARPEQRGMGTTCTAAAIQGDEIALAHVGDSRAYRVRDGEALVLTRDHSLVAQLVLARQITPEQARVDPRRNVVTRSVGVAETIEIDSGTAAGGLLRGDTLVLCTDGLHGLVEDEEIAKLAQGQDLERACGALIDLAKARGGHDNITVILARLA